MNLNFKFSEDIEEENRGFICHKLSVVANDRELGYIKVSYIPSSVYRTCYASALDYAVKHAGWHMDDRFYDLATVSYSRVYEEFQRKGIATAMYLEMARQLKKRYYIKLRASALWESFKEKGLTKTWEGFTILNPLE